MIATLNDRRLIDEEQEFTGKTVVQKLFDEIAPKFVDRNGGYTRIIKLSDFRIGDGGNIVLLQLLTKTAKPTRHRPPFRRLRRKTNEAERNTVSPSAALKARGRPTLRLPNLSK